MSSPASRSRWLPRWSHAREVLLAAAALGLVVGVCWAGDRYTCDHLSTDPAEIEARNLALDAHAQSRCQELNCERVQIISRGECLAKIELRAIRDDRYGEPVGTFETVEGLGYSPLFRRWRLRETLDDKQILGLPSF